MFSYQQKGKITYKHSIHLKIHSMKSILVIFNFKFQAIILKTVMFSLTQYFKTTLFVLVSGVYFNLFKISTDS